MFVRLLTLASAAASLLLVALLATACSVWGNNHGEFVAFTRVGSGHDRGLDITAAGRGTEQIDSGCCAPFFIMRFRLTHLRKVGAVMYATMIVTYVHAGKGGSYAVRTPLPHVGETGTMVLKNGELWDPLTGANYCGPDSKPLACGA